jgi:glutamate/tyrosine decarboxylase-like PLP-dependent enzyme
MVASALDERMRADVAAGLKPLMAVATAGTVGTGVVDPIREIADTCREHGAWLHVDGAYGAPAAVLDEVPPDLKHLALADSIAVDPHKWLYSPLEAGCVMVRDAELMRSTFAYHPSYYKFGMMRGEETDSLVHYSLQNSRGFRALKVWLALRQVGRNGYAEMIGEDIELAKRMFELAEGNSELEAVTHSLSITTFRFVPGDDGTRENEEYLTSLNQQLLTRIQEGGEAYLSHAVVEGKYLLRLCVVNFRTTRADIDALPEIIVRLGREIHEKRSRAQ